MMRFRIRYSVAICLCKAHQPTRIVWPCRITISRRPFAVCIARTSRPAMHQPTRIVWPCSITIPRYRFTVGIVRCLLRREQGYQVINVYPMRSFYISQDDIDDLLSIGVARPMHVTHTTCTARHPPAIVATASACVLAATCTSFMDVAAWSITCCVTTMATIGITPSASPHRHHPTGITPPASHHQHHTISITPTPWKRFPRSL